MANKLKLYFDTVRYLRPVQIMGQLIKGRKLRRRYADSQSAPPVQELHLASKSLDTGVVYLQRFDVGALCRYDMVLLHESHRLNLSDWQIQASPLWRFNLQYFEYGIALGATYRQTSEKKYYECFKSLVQSWIQVHHEPTGDAWHPYTISLRLPNWLIAAELFGAVFAIDERFKCLFYDSLYVQYRTLLLRQETWNLGNHYLENLKASLLGSLLFGEQDIFRKHWLLWLRELQEEILADGFHFELSPMYHKIVLEDLIRVTAALQSQRPDLSGTMLPFVQQMLDAAIFLEEGCSRTLLFNDSGDNVARPLNALAAACRESFGLTPQKIKALPEAGYYRLQSGEAIVVMDAGAAGPDYMPGHAHCDCLSFELFYQGTPLLVNCGTGIYQGDQRAFFRSTVAHNTVRINGHEQSECWGEHRVARRVRPWTVYSADGEIKASCRNYLGEVHKRRMQLSPSALYVEDSCTGSDTIRAESYLHLASGLQVQEENGVLHICKGSVLLADIMPVDCNYTIRNQPSAAEFGQIGQSMSLTFSWSGTGTHGYKVFFGQS